MLDDVERRWLAEIEAWFEVNDPVLTRRLARGRSRRQILAAALVTLTMALAVTGGILLAGPRAGIAGGLTVAAIVTGWWLERHRRPSARNPLR